MSQPAAHWALLAEVSALYASYCEALDDGDIERWPTFFVADSSYRLTTRDNVARDLPVCFVRCDGLPMLRDRAAGLKKAVFFRPRQQRRVVSSVRFVGRSEVGTAGTEVRASFLLFESIADAPSQLLCCGESRDLIVRDGDELKFKRRLCVIDASVMPDTLVFPV